MTTNSTVLVEAHPTAHRYVKLVPCAEVEQLMRDGWTMTAKDNRQGGWVVMVKAAPEYKRNRRWFNRMVNWLRSR